MENKAYIYVLKCPISGLVRYVGSTEHKEQRKRAHRAAMQYTKVKTKEQRPCDAVLGHGMTDYFWIASSLCSSQRRLIVH